MKNRTYLTTRFDYDADFYVEVCEDYDGVISFYLCRDDNGVKSHMFGLRKENAPVEKWEELIKSNTAFHIEYYNKHYNE